MDLNAPLGMGPPRPRRRVPMVLAGCAVAGLLATAGYLLATADPRGGEPYAVAVLPPPVPAKPAVPTTAPPAAPVDPTTTGSVPPSASAGAPGAASGAPGASQRTTAGPAGSYDEGTLENGVRVFRGNSVPTPARGPLVIDVSRQIGAPPKARADSGKPDLGKPDPGKSDPGKSDPGKPDPGKSDVSKADVSKAGVSKPGGLASDGARADRAAPQVAIYVAGMGAGPATRTAIDIMPPAVTLAFLPYGEAELAASVAAATARGHEVLLQLPMQNNGGTSPGAHALRPGETATALSTDLDWLFNSFKGYDGLANLLGAPVTADAAVMAGVLKAAAGRGLFFVDDGTNRRSLALDVAAQQQVPALRADVVLDATADPAVVEANLERLVEIARRKGAAVGMASGLPEHLVAIARFAAALSGKNIVLVPVGTLARGGASVATVAR